MAQRMPLPERQAEFAPVAAHLADARFRALLGEAAWSELPEPVRQRFAKRIPPGEATVYRGRVVHTMLPFAGWLLAQLARVAGAPLPLRDGATGAAVVAVTEEPGLQGQRWVRLYERPGRAPQMVQSAKRFRGATGLEEHVGGGVAMQLLVSVEAGALVFRSGRYFFEFGRLRLTLPRFLSPGTMTIVHRQQADGSFSFHLTLEHGALGRLLDQLAIFRDT